MDQQRMLMFLCYNTRPVRLAYQPPASSTFLSEQTSHQQPASSTFLSQQISTSHQPPAKRTGCKLVPQMFIEIDATRDGDVIYTSTTKANFAYR
jgi:hypothetical protein